MKRFIHAHHTRVLLAAISLIACFTLIACSDRSVVGPESVTANLRVNDVFFGSGNRARTGSKLTVEWTGTLEDGTSIGGTAGTPFHFTLDVGQVIEGWDRGLLGVRAGGHRHHHIAPALAYGATGSPPLIPPNATLEFDVFVQKVE